LPLDVRNYLAGIGLVPAPIEVLRHHPELDHEIAGQVLRLDLAALFSPQLDKCLLIVAHYDPSVRAADEVAAVENPALESGAHAANPIW
jgi:hypothetical protein